MHNPKVERFYKPQDINGMVATAHGPIKTFVMRGIKESPSYLHDGLQLTLEDVVKFFNIIQELKLNKQEKADLVEFLQPQPPRTGAACTSASTRLYKIHGTPAYWQSRKREALGRRDLRAGARTERLRFQ
jgi:hypothetical protein